MTIRTAGRPRIRARRISGITGAAVCFTAATTEIATGQLSVTTSQHLAYETLTEVDCERNGGREDQGSDKLNEDNKLHAETKGSAKIPDQDQLHQVVDCTVDPSSSLREKNRKLIWNCRFADSLGDKNLLSLWESLEHKSR